jgi:phosphate-selective porin
MGPARRAARVATKPAPAAETARTTNSLSTADEARAAELEAHIVADDRASSGGGTKSRGRGDAAIAQRARGRESGLLAARAEQEYTYVQRDVRRIAKVDGGLVVVMLVLFLLIDVLGIIKL